MDSIVTGSLAISAIIYAGGAVLAGVLPGRASALVAAVAIALAGVGELLAGYTLLSGNGDFHAGLYRLYPFGLLQIRGDTLSGLFLLLTGAISLGVALYNWSYFQHQTSLAARVQGVLLQLLLLSVLGIVLADDLVLFLLSWEVMSVVSYLLTCSHYEDRRATHGALLMLVMSHAGAAAFLTAFVLLSGSVGGTGFAAMQSGAPHLQERIRDASFLLFFLGFGVKAGVVPLHIWVPAAYEAAPSSFSAVLAGILVNMGIYGIIRFAVQMVGTGPMWWGFVVAGLGSVSALLGILYALMERDMKRFLAYSSVENVGIILIGVGASMVFAASHQPILAALAMTAALFHTLNHATSKGLLFLGAGAIDYATNGSRDMDRLGGLIRLLPWSAALFLVGSLSIAAIPPFNGFITEWLTLEALLQSFHLADVGAKIALAGAGVALALTAGLAVTAFVRAYGIAFLGLPRSAEAENAREVPRGMRWGMLVIALEAVALGIWATAFIPWFTRISARLYGPDIAASVVPTVYTHPAQNALLVHLGGGLFRPLIPGDGPVVIPGYATFSAASPAFLAIWFVAGGVTLGGALWLLTRVRSARRVEVWAGGIERFTPDYQYTATSFANPLRSIFSLIYQPRTESDTSFQVSRYFRTSVSYHGSVAPFFEEYIYLPSARWMKTLAAGVGVIQSGSVNLYLAYIFVILVVVLLVVR